MTIFSGNFNFIRLSEQQSRLGGITCSTLPMARSPKLRRPFDPPLRPLRAPVTGRQTSKKEQDLAVLYLNIVMDVVTLNTKLSRSLGYKF
jgi:hypothetical protein